LNATLTLTFDGGHGSTTLTWDGTTYWFGSKAFGCGDTVSFRFNTACSLEYICGDVGGTWTVAPCAAIEGSCFLCGPPFSTTPYTFSLSAERGCTCEIDVTGVLSE
jgi:hypothetical protein